MVRVSLYLSSILYKTIKLKAKEQNMTLPYYLRNFLESQFIVNNFIIGKYHWGGMTNEEIDEAIYG